MRRLGCLALLVLAACNPRPCKRDTVLVTLQLLGEAADADQLEVTVFASGQTMRATASHAVGANTGTLEIDFPLGYPARQSIDVTVGALRHGVLVASGTGATFLGGVCATLALTLDPGGSLATDGSAGDGPASSLDMTLPMVACGTPNAVRCNPSNHRVEQHCDPTLMQWVDAACPATATAPVYACSVARDRCAHTAWAQWRGGDPPSASRSFTVIADASGKQEDIVQDNWTKLQWQRRLPDATYTWDASATPDPASAQYYCDHLNYGGYSDWRLPTPIELVTIVDRTIPSQQVMIQQPFAAYTFAAEFWTSAPNVSPNAPAGDGWYVDFTYGIVYAHGSKFYQDRARCVR